MPSDLVRVGLKRLPEGAGLPLPSYMTAESAGADLFAAVYDEIVLAPGARALVPTGISLELPPGYEAQIRPRSGIALRHGITLLNAPGTIDADYRGPIAVIMVNFGDHPFTVLRGDRIAQLIVAPVCRAIFIEQGELRATYRGEGGFGSTGTSGENGALP